MGSNVGRLSAPQKLTPVCKTEGFDCGVEALNAYLQTALKNQGLGNSICHVVTDETSAVVGYYTLSNHSIARPSPAKPRDMYNQAPDPVPTVLLGRFAVHKNWQGRGIGQDLLFDAFGHIAGASDKIGMRAVIVDAKTAKVRAFYERIGFRSLGDLEDPNRLYLLIKDLAATIESMV